MQNFNLLFIHNMFSSKFRLLVVSLAFGAGVWCVGFWIARPPAAVQPSNSAVFDARFERAEIDKNLQAQADALLPLFDAMRSVPVYLKDAPILESGTNVETGNAYTYCDGGAKPLIFVKKNYYRTASQVKLANTLKHELTHAWLCRQNLMSAGHGEIFRRKLKQIGGWLNRESISETLSKTN